MRIVALAIFAPLVLVGCEAAEPRATMAPFYVPATAIRRSDVPADYVLPTNSYAEAPIPRGTREAYGPAVGEADAYTIFTYDQQPIGGPWEGSYRYRYVVRQGVTLP